MYEICLIRIKEQVGEKRSTVCTHRYADCLLKNTSTRHNNYFVNVSLFVRIMERSLNFVNLCFLWFLNRVFQQTVGIPMGTNCAPLLADLFLYSYEADFIHGLLKKNDKIYT
jgi:hypothetical protein